jgi:Uma2 family endonuclease
MEHAHHVQDLATTRAAEGLPRRPWTVADIERMVEVGLIHEKERFELIGGEIVPMSPKGDWHENVKRALNVHWAKALPPELFMLPETTLRVDPRNFREPDFVFWSSSIPVSDLKPKHVQLIVEVSDSSLGYDLGQKAKYYASLGFADYWVIDAKRLLTRIHRDPGLEGFSSVADHRHTQRMTPLLLPVLAVKLTDLGLQPVMD